MKKVVPVLSTIKKVVKKARQKAKFSSSGSVIQKNKDRKAVEKRKHHSISVVKKAKAKAKRKYQTPFHTVVFNKKK